MSELAWETRILGNYTIVLVYRQRLWDLYIKQLLESKGVHVEL